MREKFVLCCVCIEGIDTMMEFIDEFVYDKSEKSLLSFYA